MMFVTIGYFPKSLDKRFKVMLYLIHQAAESQEGGRIVQKNLPDPLDKLRRMM